jgi:hypothetical protein
MWLLGRLGAGGDGAPPPRSYAEIRASVDDRDAEHVRRLNRVEESLLALTAEAGLDDLRRRLEATIRHD